jgi:hypothetical protein
LSTKSDSFGSFCRTGLGHLSNPTNKSQTNSETFITSKPRWNTSAPSGLGQFANPTKSNLLWCPPTNMEPLGQHKLSFSPAESRAMLSNAQ